MKTVSRNRSTIVVRPPFKLLNKLNEALRVAQSSKDNNAPEKEYLTRQEVVKMCGVRSLSTLWDWNRKGLLEPCASAGRKPLYKYEDVQRFLLNSRS